MRVLLPTLNDWRIPAAFRSYLEPNEQLLHSAYGMFRPPRLILVEVLGSLSLPLWLWATPQVVRVAGGGCLASITWAAGYCLVYYLLVLFPISKWGRTYFVGLTPDRFIILSLKTPMLSSKPDTTRILSVIEYSRQRMPPVAISSGSMYTTISISDNQQPFKAKFPHYRLQGNRAETRAI